MLTSVFERIRGKNGLTFTICVLPCWRRCELVTNSPGITIPYSTEMRRKRHELTFELAILLLIRASLTGAESEDAYQNSTVGPSVTECDSLIKHYDQTEYSKLHCGSPYTQQYCNVTSDEEWKCLLRKADLQNLDSCRCMRQEPAVGSDYCMSVDFCVFVENIPKCNKNYKCSKPLGARGVECRYGDDTFHATCTLHLLHCEAENILSCLAKMKGITFNSILRENCLGNQFRDKEVLFFIEKAHFDNTPLNYSNIKAMNKDGEDVTALYCQEEQYVWKYIISTLAIILFLSLCGFGCYRFKRYEKAQDLIWDERMNRNTEQLEVVLGSGQEEESVYVTATQHEYFDEVLPKDTQPSVDAIKKENVQLGSESRISEENRIVENRDEALQNHTIDPVAEETSTTSFGNPSYVNSACSASPSTDGVVLLPSVGLQSRNSYVNSPTLVLPLCDGAKFLTLRSGDGYTSKNGDISPNEPQVVIADSSDSFLFDSKGSKSMSLDGYTEKSSTLQKFGENQVSNA